MQTTIDIQAVIATATIKDAGGGSQPLGGLLDRTPRAVAIDYIDDCLDRELYNGNHGGELPYSHQVLVDASDTWTGLIEQLQDCKYCLIEDTATGRWLQWLAVDDRVGGGYYQ